MRVFIAGATGVIGRRLVPVLLTAGHEVHAMTRSEDRAARLRATGAAAVVCDVYDGDRLRAAIAAARPEVVIHQLTALPKRINPRRIHRDAAATNRLRREGTQLLVDAAREAGARRFVAQSIAFAHRPGDRRPRSEDDPLYLDAPSAFRDVIAAVAELERLTTLDDVLEGIALRYGFFCGPGTAYAPGGSFHEDVMRRRVPIIGDGAGVFPLIDVDDAAAATVAALTRGEPGGIYHVVDDAPEPVASWLPAYAAEIGAPPPRKLPRWLGRLGAGAYGVYLMCEHPAVSNARAKSALGWQPRHRGWRESLADSERDPGPSADSA